MKSTIGLGCVLLFATMAVAQDEEGTTPGALPDPGTYQGSMQLQQQEHQQNQQMQERLDQNYRQYAPNAADGQAGGGRAVGGGAPRVNWWNLPALAPERNPLLGRWQQVASKGVSAQHAASPLAGLLPAGAADMVSSAVNSTLAGGCKSMFGSGVIAFEPEALQWVAPDGHEEILNNVAYRANGSEVIVLTKDPGAVPALIFGFPDHNRAVVAFFNCTMDRQGTKPKTPAAPAAPAGAVAVVAATSPGVAPSGPANAVVEFQVSVGPAGKLTPLAAVQFWVTPENPANALVTAGIRPAGGIPLSQFLNADCRNQSNCIRDWNAMTGKALGSVQTDAAGHAHTPHIASGRYYVVGFAPYDGKALFWSVPFDARAGSITIMLNQTNSATIEN